MKLKEGYIIDLTLEDAIQMFDGLYLDPQMTRKNGQTRMIYNYAVAWIKIREHLNKKEVN